MAPVGIKYVVSFSSQDDHHKVQNLLTGDGFRKWLSHPKEKSGVIEAVLQLEEPSFLAYIDIGSHWCATIELKVGRSDWPQGTLYRTLVPTSCLLTPVESKIGKGIVKTKMFSSENFAPDVASEKWDRIQLILRQPYRKDVQYGLSFIRIKAPGSKTGSDECKGKKTKDMISADTNKSVVSIQKHFFGDKSHSSNESPDPVKSRLMKIAGTTENGSEQVGVLSRTAKLVLSASENAGKYSPQARAGPSKSAKMALFSEHLVQKYGSSFDEELDEFLSTLQLADIDLDQVTIADLRHRFEKKKLRKLTTEEKKVFMQKCGDYISSLFDAAERDQEISPPVNYDTSPKSFSPKSYKKSTAKLYSTPSCKRKLENETDVTRTPKTSRREFDSDVIVDTVMPKDEKFVRSNATKLDDKWEKSTLPSQRGLIIQVEKAFEQTERTDKRVPFAHKTLNSANENLTPKSLKKGKTGKPCTPKYSPADRKDTCGMWLSKGKGTALDDLIEKTPETDVRQKTPRGGRGKGRGRKKRGEDDSGSAARGRTATDEEKPGYGNYVYCSSCKGNVPERVFSDHFITCDRSDTSPSMYRNRSPSPPPTTYTAATSLTHSSASSTVGASDSTINISGDSDVMITNDSLNLVECPLCGEFYAADIITVHADVCATAMEMSVL